MNKILFNLCKIWLRGIWIGYFIVKKFLVEYFEILILYYFSLRNIKLIKFMKI